MKPYVFWGYHTQLDEIATQNWYASHSEWGCQCGHCQNFLALAKKRELPSPMLDLLDTLGIPPQKATYVCQNYADEQGHHYQISYRICGRILNKPETEVFSFDWGEGLCFHESYPYGAPDFPEPHFDLGFFITLPWVLEESEED